MSAQGGRLSKKKDGPGPDRERLLAIVPRQQANPHRRARRSPSTTSPGRCCGWQAWSLRFEHRLARQHRPGSVRLCRRPSTDRVIRAIAAEGPVSFSARRAISPAEPAWRKATAICPGCRYLNREGMRSFRTWAAPEMPRPGCVWSHVLLLGRQNLGFYRGAFGSPAILPSARRERNVLLWRTRWIFRRHVSRAR